MYEFHILGSRGFTKVKKIFIISISYILAREEGLLLGSRPGLQRRAAQERLHSDTVQGEGEALAVQAKVRGAPRPAEPEQGGCRESAERPKVSCSLFEAS